VLLSSACFRGQRRLHIGRSQPEFKGCASDGRKRPAAPADSPRPSTSPTASRSSTTSPGSKLPSTEIMPSGSSESDFLDSAALAPVLMTSAPLQRLARTREASWKNDRQAGRQAATWRPGGASSERRRIQRTQQERPHTTDAGAAEMMGPGKYENVGKSQSVLMMIDPMISSPAPAASATPTFRDWRCAGGGRTIVPTSSPLMMRLSVECLILPPVTHRARLWNSALAR
jgi:hypothetical protein